MSREKQLTPKQVENGINRYFKSITITKLVFDNIETGKDGEGKPIFKKIPRLNNLGKQLKYTEFTEHPSMTKLAHYLGIHRDTLLNYSKDSEYFGSVKKGKEIIESYLEDRLFGNNVTGVIFNLKNNYGWEDRSKHDISVDKSLEDFFSSDEE